MRIRKAIVTAAGWGTRFLPATKAQPKEMLPLVDKPSIQYVVEEAVESGIEQIIIVTALGKRAIEDHFDRSFELEYALAQRGEMEKLEQVRRISDLGDICYIRQKEQKGLGHAILLARDLIGDEPFAVFLPDDIIDSEVPCMKQMIEVFQHYGGGVIAVEKVGREQTESYGIIDPEEVEGGIYRIRGLVEKPAPEEAPSNLAIVGRYILTPEIFATLQFTAPGKNQEVQLTDGLAQLLSRQPLFALEFEGTRHDAGNPLGFLKASVEMALRRPDIGPEFRRYLQALCLREEITQRTPLSL